MPGVTKPATGPVFKEDKFEARGIRFELLEVDAQSYDQLVKMFTTTNPITEAETLDEASFVTALAVKAIEVPQRMTAETFGAYPQALRRTIEARVRAMHLVLDEIKEIKEDSSEDDGPPAGA